MSVKDEIQPVVPAVDDAPRPAFMRFAQSLVSYKPPKKSSSPYEGFSWMGNIWLVYSIFFIVDPIQRHSVKHWIALAVVYPVFLSIYFSFYRVTAPWFQDARGTTLDPTGTRQRLVIALAMFLLGAGYIPVNTSSGGLVVYAAAYLPFILESVPMILAILAGGSVFLAIEGYLLHLNPWAWLTGVFFGFIVAISNLAVARQKRADCKLRMANDEIEHLAKIAERERIARDLHDVLGHTLSVIVLKSELAGRLIDRDPARTAREIADVEQIARKALAEVREAIGGYRAEGLVAEIERAHRTLDAAGVRLICESKPPNLCPAEETVLSLVLREAITNIVRHAAAQTCDIRFQENEGFHFVTVHDDGRGGVRAEGNGLRGMRERIEALGGKFSVDPGAGTRLIIQVPASSVKTLVGEAQTSLTQASLPQAGPVGLTAEISALPAHEVAAS
ncbi:MAG TPA: sensor histidine kinase [Acidisarcina sp.]